MRHFRKAAVGVSVWACLDERIPRGASLSLIAFSRPGLQPRCRKSHEGTGSVRFVSVPNFFDNSSVRFGSVWKIKIPFRRSSACVFSEASWLGPVRFSFRVRFRPVPELNGSVRFGSAGPVWIHSLLKSSRTSLLPTRLRQSPLGVLRAFTPPSRVGGPAGRAGRLAARQRAQGSSLGAMAAHSGCRERPPSRIKEVVA